MSREEKVLNMQITIANTMKQEWNIDFYKVSELLDKYDLLPYIDTCYESYNSMGINGILQDLKSYMDAIERAANDEKFIVIGPTADENTVTIINAYKEELLATNYAEDVLDSLINELEPENLPKQYFFGTSAAIEKLRFKRNRREIVG